MSSIPSDPWEFVKVRRRWWPAPMLGTMVLPSALIASTHGSAVAPFIHA